MEKKDKKSPVFPLSFLLMGTFFCICFLTSNILEIKVIALGPISATAGLFVFPLSYVLNDCITEIWGYKRSCLVIWMAFFSNLIVVLLTQCAVHLPSPSWWGHDTEFNFVFGMVPKVLAASLITFLIGSFVNSAVMSRMKVAENGKYFPLRAIVSTLCGEGIDTVIFIPVVFGGLMPSDELMKMMLVQFSIKSLFEIIILPVTVKVVKWTKRREDTDTYDYKISYNPFKL